jgi:hypothetical protein
LASRIQLILTVYAFAAVGVFLLFAPWSPLWEAATPAFQPTPAGTFFGAGWLRGFVSGLGALNLWVALQAGVALMRALKEPQGTDGGA